VQHLSMFEDDSKLLRKSVWSLVGISLLRILRIAFAPFNFEPLWPGHQMLPEMQIRTATTKPHIAFEGFPL